MHDFLSPEDHQAVLNWVIANESAFQPATVTTGIAGSGVEVDASKRTALVTRNLGPLEQRLRGALMDALPLLRERTGTGGPVPDSLELEFAAHGDGAHFVAHTDTSYGADRRTVGGRDGAGEDRLLSAVYYFHAEPQGFEGGALRLYRVGADPKALADNDFIELQPLQNSLIAFPSWALHEVRPVRCASARFRDYRFALNCWYCASLKR
jgi:SM-20-related protein